MTTQSNNQGTTSDSGMLIWATWLWILAGTLSGGVIGVKIATTNPYGVTTQPFFAYRIVFVSIGFT